jgi:hypothetical protein
LRQGVKNLVHPAEIKPMEKDVMQMETQFVNIKNKIVHLDQSVNNQD